MGSTQFLIVPAKGIKRANERSKESIAPKEGLSPVFKFFVVQNYHKESQ